MIANCRKGRGFVLDCLIVPIELRPRSSVASSGITGTGDQAELHFSEAWFHGNLERGRETAEQMLYENAHMGDGTFIVRKSQARDLQLDHGHLLPGGAAICPERFCKMFSESSPGCWAVLQLPCCPSKQGELSENLLQNLGKKWPPHLE